MKRIFFLATLLLLALSGWSQLRMPIIQSEDVNPDRNEKPVRISNVKIDVKVVGSLAVTTVDMTFHNPNHRVLEGELQFPLADGQSISRFALDINGKLREGVVVEKAKGQKTFEDIARRGVDPGLLEKTEGNNFRTRVYPLPANGTRHVVIAYEQELIPADGKYRFHLPVEYQDVLDKFEVNLAVYANEQQPSIDSTPWGDFSFNKSGKAYVASYSAEKYPAKGQIVFSVPVKDETKLYVEKGKISNQTVFYAQLFPEVKQAKKQQPGEIALFWDASSSMYGRNTELEFELLDKYFYMVQNQTVKLYSFNCNASKEQTFLVRNGHWSELKKALENTTYDGATQLGTLDFSKVKTGEILLFSDGLSNFGKSLPTTGTTPVTTISASMKADYSMLKYLSSTTGGDFINLMQQTTDEAIEQMSNQSLYLIAIDYNKQEIEELTTSGNTINPQQGLSVAGRLTGNRASLVLKFGIGGQTTYTERLTINANDAIDYGNMVERLWAAKRIAQLDQLYDYNKAKIEELGRTYNIVTRNTSLIVLEEVMDYIRYEIAPPAELKEEYDRLLGQRYNEKKRVKEDQIEYAVRLLEKRKQWWNKDYKPAPPKREPAPGGNRIQTPGNGRYTVTGTVKDESGEALPGVSIIIENKAGLGAMTNLDGQYSIRVDRGDRLQFNYIGFERQTIEVSGNATINIVMEESSNALEEVVVTGFGSQRKETMVGAVTTVDVSELRTPTSDLSKTLVGAVPGVIARQASGEPGESPAEVWLRGISSSENENSAPVLIDGVEGSLSNIRIEDIKSYSIVRDASATAIYGARAANGVIVITTKSGQGRTTSKGNTTVKKWQPDAPYMNKLKETANNELYAAYLEIKPDYLMTPSFYLDVATLFEEREMKEEAFLILSNLAELKMENYRLLRVLAHRLKQLGYNDYAISIFRKVLELRPEEPQSYRDLGLTYAQNGDYQEAIDMLYQIIEQRWDSRFTEIEIFAVEEINNIIAKAKAEKKKIDVSKIDQRLIFNMPVDIRIVLNWDTDNSDMDLWVTDPHGEKCYYRYQLTKTGGMITRDFTQGYGPEAFLINKASKGKYIIQADYFGTREQTLIGPTTIYLDIYTYYGTPKEKKKTIMLRLTRKKEVIDIGEIEF